MNTSYTLPVNALLLLGPTGAGKSPLGDYLAAHGLAGRSCHHFDFGAELRAIASGGASACAYHKDEITFVHGVLEEGLLLENEQFRLAEKIIRLFLGRAGFADGHILVLNGLPRHVGQAADIARIADVHVVVLLECSADDVLCRIDDNIGGDRNERVDDERGLVEKKLDIFHERTAPLVGYYEKKGCRIYRLSVSGTMTPEETYQQLSSLAAVDPPVAFVAEPPER